MKLKPRIKVFVFHVYLFQKHRHCDNRLCTGLCTDRFIRTSSRCFDLSWLQTRDLRQTVFSQRICSKRVIITSSFTFYPSGPFCYVKATVTMGKAYRVERSHKWTIKVELLMGTRAKHCRGSRSTRHAGSVTLTLMDNKIPWVHSPTERWWSPQWAVQIRSPGGL